MEIKNNVYFLIDYRILSERRGGGGVEKEKYDYETSMCSVTGNRNGKKTTLVVISHCCDFAFDDSDETVSNRSNNGTFTIITATGSRKS